MCFTHSLLDSCVLVALSTATLESLIDSSPLWSDKKGKAFFYESLHFCQCMKKLEANAQNFFRQMILFDKFWPPLLEIPAIMPPFLMVLQLWKYHSSKNQTWYRSVKHAFEVLDIPVNKRKGVTRLFTLAPALLGAVKNLLFITYNKKILIEVSIIIL